MKAAAIPLHGQDQQGLQTQLNQVRSIPTQEVMGVVC